MALDFAGTKLMNSIEPVLSQFDAHTLADLDKATLMERVDVKFLLPIEVLPELLEQLRSHYSVLEIDNKRVSRYYNQYFDTPSMRFYRHHHNGKLNRYKVRQRTYLDTDTQFLEVKFKNNQKRTYKSRILCDQSAPHQQQYNDFVRAKMGQDFSELSLSQTSGYRRIALANEQSAERLTLDFDLWFESSDAHSKHTLSGFFIAELKQKKRAKQSAFYQLMSQNNIFPSAFSKYCIGCALLYSDTLKTNRFKFILNQIHQLSTTPHIKMSA